MGASRRFYRRHHDAPTRTTITLDPDVEQLLRYATQRTGLTFKSALNEGLRRGLAHLTSSDTGKKFVVKARRMGLRAGLDPARWHDRVHDLEAEAFAVTTLRLRRSPRK